MALTIESAFIDGPIYALEKLGFDIVFHGPTYEDDDEYWKLSIEKSPTRTTFYYIDKETFLIYKTVDETIKGGQKLNAQTIYRGYREIGPIKIAMRFHTTDQSGSSRIFIEDLVFGFAAKDELFQKPE